MTPKLILVSNREPYVLKRAADGQLQTHAISSGLMGALHPAMQAVGGHWISWSGFDRETPRQPELPERLEVPLGDKTLSLRRIPLSEREASLYYYGFACRTLWPLMHLHLGRVQFDAEAWRAYRRVNQRFTDAVLEAYQPDDLIWIHDFHLALVPAMLREALPSARIGFSWHIPWAPVEVLRALPWCREITAGILGADQCGFSLPRHATQFLAAAETLPGVSVVRREEGEGAVLWSERQTRVTAFPLGCAFERWEAWASASRGGRVVRLRRNMVAERLALAVDRLDHTRGMMERISSVQRFFDRYPSWRGRLVFCQIAVPSRTRAEEYREMKREIDALIEDINNRFQQGAWHPIRYLYRAFSPEELAVYYAASDVALLTPLSDGLSMVPFEYLASRTREDGSLILSSLAGAADELREASIVNPYDEEEVAETLHDVLERRPEDTRATMRVLRERARGRDSARWLTSFFRAAWGEEMNRPSQAARPSEPSVGMAG